MIYTLVASFKDLNYDAALELINPEYRAQIELKKTLEGKRESLAARLALAWLYKRAFGKEPPRLRVNDDGKPYYECGGGEKRISISISHTDTAVAVCLFEGEDMNVGVDIESLSHLPKAERCRKIAERLSLYDMALTQGACEKISFLFASLAPDGGIVEESAPSVLTAVDEEENRGFARLWCSAEAILKASGRGFGDVGQLRRLAECGRTSTFAFCAWAEEYTVAVASLPCGFAEKHC